MRPFPLWTADWVLLFLLNNAFQELLIVSQLWLFFFLIHKKARPGYELYNNKDITASSSSLHLGFFLHDQVLEPMAQLSQEQWGEKQKKPACLWTSISLSAMCSAGSLAVHVTHTCNPSPWEAQVERLIAGLGPAWSIYWDSGKNKMTKKKKN